MGARPVHEFRPASGVPVPPLRPVAIGIFTTRAPPAGRGIHLQRATRFRGPGSHADQTQGPLPGRPPDEIPPRHRRSPTRRVPSSRRNMSTRCLADHAAGVAQRLPGDVGQLHRLVSGHPAGGHRVAVQRDARCLPVRPLHQGLQHRAEIHRPSRLPLRRDELPDLGDHRVQFPAHGGKLGAGVGRLGAQLAFSAPRCGPAPTGWRRATGSFRRAGPG
jgi:hypothetical protein